MLEHYIPPYDATAVTGSKKKARLSSAS